MTEYDKNSPLTETDLAPDPLAQLQRWLQDAQAAGQIEPTAMTLATVNADGRPSARMVLYKGTHDGALTFFTNYDSRKGSDLATRAHAALVFWWDKLERQVRVEGRVTKTPAALSEQYFHSRARLSQLAALTSRQSRVVKDRAELDARLAASEKKFAGVEVPHPEFWGGYALAPDLFEFWQGRRGRLHDRLVYRRSGKTWKIERLEP